VKPADQAAKLLEMNQKKEEQDQMDEKILSAFVSDIKNALVEVNSKNDEQAKIIAERDTTISELNASIATIQAAMQTLQADRDKIYQDLEASWAATKLLEEELGKEKVKSLIGELNATLEPFTAEEQKFAEVEINAFKENPIEGDLNVIKTKILATIGEKALEAKHIAEQNSKNNPDDSDIFSEVFTPKSDDKDNDKEVELF
jgi:chromosome segregation ATPase